MTFVDDIRDFVTVTFFPEVSDPSSEIFGYVLLFVMAAVLIIAAVSITRYLLRLNERPPGHYIGSYKFTGLVNETEERTRITGHLSRDNNILSPKMLQDLKRIKDIETEYPALVELAKSEKIFVYNFNPTEFEKEDVFKQNKQALIISTVDLSDQKYYYEDQKGDFSFTAAGFKNYPRTVDCFYTSDYAEIPNPKGQMVDVFRIAVIPNTLKEKVKKGLTDIEYSIEIAQFPDNISADTLGTIALQLPSLVQSWKRIEPAEKENLRLIDKNQLLRNELAEKERAFEPTKHRALRRSMVGHPDAQGTKKLGVAWGWRIGYFVAGIAGILVIPQISFLSWLGELGGAFVGFIIILFLNYIIETKGQHEDEKPQEANEAEVN